MSTLVIGREPELAAVHGFVDSVPDGAAVLLLEGEAGIGKTTIWRAAVEAWQQRGLRLLRAGPADSEARFSFAALDDLLGAVLEEASSDLPEPQRKALAVALLREPARGRAPEQRAVAVAFLGALRALARTEPLLVAIDDVQWLDAASAAALTYAVRRLETERIGFLLTQRTSEGAPVALGLDRDVAAALTRLRVEPLSLAATQHVLERHLGSAPSRPVLRRLHDAAGGNPFFSLELARALEGALSPEEPLRVPQAMRSLVRERLGGMPGETLRALLAAALLAEPTLARVSEATWVDAEAALALPVREQMVDVTGGRIRFAHPLFASAVVEIAAPERRRALHRRLAETAQVEEERARHLALGSEGPDAEVAAVLDEAARAVAMRAAPETAAELAELARRLTPPDQTEQAARRAIDAAWYIWAAGDADAARTLLLEAAEMAPPGPVHGLAIARLLRLSTFAGGLQAGPDLFRAVLEEAGDDLALRTDVYECFAWNRLISREDIAGAVEYGRRTVELAERLGSVSELTEALTLVAQAEFILGGGLPSATMQRALEVDVGVEEGRVLRRASANSWLLLACSDQLEKARGVLENACELAATLGDESSPPWLLMRLSQVELLAGDWQRAAEHVERGQELAEQNAHRAMAAAAVSTRALLEAHRGQEEAARSFATEGLALAEETGSGVARRHAQHAIGLLEVSLQNFEAAELVLGPLRRASERAGVIDPGENRYLGDLIEALVALGRHEEAEEVTDGLARLGEKLRRDSAIAIAGRGRGLLCSARGEHGQALEELAQALDRHPRSLPFERARTLLAYGSALRRLKRIREARSSLEEAQAAFDGLGARVWHDRAAAELGALGGRTRSRDELTAAERRVASLVAEGRTNREVASTLFVTDRTVESHLSHIYAKLGVRSRAELAHRYRDSP